MENGRTKVTELGVKDVCYPIILNYNIQDYISLKNNISTNT